MPRPRARSCGYQDLIDQAHEHRTYSIILAGTGAALVGSGIVRFALHGSEESRGVAIAPTSTGGLVTYGGRL